MKKTLLIASVIISLSGISFIFFRLYSSLQRDASVTLADLPVNLDFPADREEFSVPTAVPILMYHHISGYPNDGNPSIYASLWSFEVQMEWLSSHGFRTVGLDYFRYPKKIDGKPIILTFDDGYQDAYTQAFPVLKKYGFLATFYIVTDDIDRNGYLSKNEISEMRSAGMNFGSHSLSHPDLTAASQRRAEREIYNSKKILEQVIGTTVTDFCYPGGAHNWNVENIVANSGYTTATTTDNDVVFGKIDPLRLNRLNIGNETNFDDVPALKNL